jgi:hypothetical protein
LKSRPLRGRVPAVIREQVVSDDLDRGVRTYTARIIYFAGGELGHQSVWAHYQLSHLQYSDLKPRDLEAQLWSTLWPRVEEELLKGFGYEDRRRIEGEWLERHGKAEWLDFHEPSRHPIRAVYQKGGVDAAGKHYFRQWSVWCPFNGPRTLADQLGTEIWRPDPPVVLVKEWSQISSRPSWLPTDETFRVPDEEGT